MRENKMNWKLFWICGIAYLSLLATGLLGFKKLSSIMFWILIALVVANFFYTAIYVLKKNREFINKK